LTKKRLEELREKVRTTEWLSREEQAEMFRGVDQLLRDEQSLADGLNYWRDEANRLELATQVPVSDTPDGSVRGFAAYLAPGDESLRAWLLAAAEAFIADEPCPPRRA
jgi:hypothetical protein